jgi:alpha-beta hydrolase superfamily lysophospholipase
VRPLYFGSPGHYGVLYEAPAGETTGRGVLLCSPLGREGVGSHRPLRSLAQRLAAGGRPTLQFDWPGYGESLGDAGDLGLVPAMLRAVPAALHELRLRSGVTDVTVVGVGSGALLAAAALAHHTPQADELVLWGAPRTGRTYLRELRAFQGLTTDGVSAAHATATLPPGAMEASGFLVTQETADGLAAIDLAEISLPAVSRILLLDCAGDARLADALGRSGSSVEIARTGGIQMLLEPPGVSLLDEAAAETIAGWLGAGAPQRHAAGLPPAVLEGSGWTEEVVAIDGPAGTMLATVARPHELRTDAWVLLLNAGAVRRSGPNRLWTRWARSWAAAGVPSLRLDATGIGDSDGADVHARTLETMCTRELVTDVQAAVRYTRDVLGAPRVVPVGLCSGAFAAYRAAVHEPSVTGAVMMNLQTTEWDRGEWERDLAQHARRSVRRRGVVRSVRRLRNTGLQTLAGATRGQLAEMRARLAISRRTSVHALPESSAAGLREELRRLRQRDVDMLFVFSSGDLGITYVTRRLGSLDALEGELGARLAVIDGPDHTFRPLWSHGVLRQAVESHLALLGVLEPAPGDAV